MACSVLSSKGNDFGGGTLDVSLLFVNDGSVEVMGTSGDNRLGGSDFDACLEEAIFQRALGLGGCEACERSALARAAERLKIALSTHDIVAFDCAASCRINVTRDQFTHACSHLFDRALRPIEEVLSGTPMGEIDEAVLVGGTGRIPRIRELVRGSARSLNTEIDPDTVVACGAAQVVD